jgi:hypothetical protein
MWAGLCPVPPAPSVHAAFGTSVENFFEELKAKVELSLTATNGSLRH